MIVQDEIPGLYLDQSEIFSPFVLSNYKKGDMPFFHAHFMKRLVQKAFPSCKTEINSVLELAHEGKELSPVKEAKMIPNGFLRQQRGVSGSLLSATVLCSLVSLAHCGTSFVEQTPAQDRFFESLMPSGWGSPAPAHPPAPAMNMPDVAGFGMYPLWKFHKFDGLSLRPVPYGVDIGSGIPPSPVPPAYPTGFLSSPQPAANGPYYGPPASPPATNYEASAPAYSPPQQQSYGSSAPAQSYGNSAPQQSYGSSAPSYGMEAQPASSYQPSTINLSYSPVAPATPAVKYNDAPQTYNAPQTYSAPQTSYSAPQTSYSAPQTSYSAPQTSYTASQTYNAPAAPSYAEPQSYGAQSSYAAPMNSYSAPAASSSGYDATQYGSGSGITIQFSAAPQEYGQQQASNYGNSPAGSYQMPTYTAIESPMSAQYPTLQESNKPMQMETGYGGGGFMKRNSPGLSKDASKTPAEPETSNKA